MISVRFLTGPKADQWVDFENESKLLPVILAPLPLSRERFLRRDEPLYPIYERNDYEYHLMRIRISDERGGQTIKVFTYTHKHMTEWEAIQLLLRKPENKN